MLSIGTKMGRSTPADDGDFPQINHFDGESGNIGGETQARLRRLAREVMSGIEEIDASHSKELLGAFVVELVFLGKEQEYREKRRQKQAERIAAAKAKGVRFGPPPKALPDNFEELRQAWREGKISLKIAAETCGIPKSTFHDAALRAEMAAQKESGGEQRPPEKRRKKRTNGIAAAKGARSGPKPRTLPEDFEELRQAWRNKKLSLKMAAEACGLPQSTFYNAAVRAETAARAVDTK